MASTFGGGSSPRDEQFRKVLILVLVSVLFLSALGAGLLLVPMLKGGGDENKSKGPAKPLFTLADPAKEAPEEMVNIYVALRTLQAGEGLTPDLFRVEAVGRSKVPLGALTSLEQISGYWVKDPIPPGKAVTLGMLTTVRPTSSLAHEIEEGHRAVTITVNEQTGVEGWARPGALVDVILLAKDGDDKLVAKSIICGVKVLSLGRQSVSQAMMQATEGGAPNTGPVPSTVTLQVPNDQVNKLVLAQASGTLTLTLRNDKDPSSGCSSSTIDIATVMNGAPKGPTLSEQPSGPIVKVTSPDGSVKKFTFTNEGLKPVEEY